MTEMVCSMVSMVARSVSVRSSVRRPRVSTLVRICARRVGSRAVATSPTWPVTPVYM
jgi:hypothetical protein